jgi:hypothetical protein
MQHSIIINEREGKKGGGRRRARAGVRWQLHLRECSGGRGGQFGACMRCATLQEERVRVALGA